jgi:hypothetical protein
LKYDHTIGTSATAFTIDSTDDAETSSTVPKSVHFLQKKLERGAAQKTDSQDIPFAGRCTGQLPELCRNFANM